MGWLNIHQSLPQHPNINLPHEVVIAFDKVVEQRPTSLFPAQLTIEGAPMMLSLEAQLDFMTNRWGI
jgi:hypothetical protein